MFSAERIYHLLSALDTELAEVGVKGEVYLTGGAVMCLVFHAREATKDVDALLVPAAEMRRAAEKIAQREGLAPDWLNDAVKGFFSEAGRFEALARYYPLDRYPTRSKYVLEELLPSA